MHNLLRRACAAVVLLIAAASAHAQSPYSWAGSYAGINVGMGFMGTDAWGYCRTPGGVVGGPGCTYTAPFKTVGNGLLGGAQGGYNHQFAWAVIGVEADLQLSAMNAGAFASNSGQSNFFVPQPYLQTIRQNIDWLATLRVRAGVLADDRVLLYATGGPALGAARLESNQSFPPFISYRGSTQATLLGFVVGGGAEYAIFDNWRLKGEVLYFDLGSLKTVGMGQPPVTAFTGGAEAWFTGVITRIGVNYRF